MRTARVLFTGSLVAAFMIAAVLPSLAKSGAGQSESDNMKQSSAELRQTDPVLADKQTKCSDQESRALKASSKCQDEEVIGNPLGSPAGTYRSDLADKD